MRKRKHVVSFHVNANELRHINEQAEASGLSREEYLRSINMGMKLKVRPCPHHADLLRKVAGLCNNANQLAYVANATGRASQDSINEMTRIAGEVWREVKEKW